MEDRPIWTLIPATIAARDGAIIKSKTTLWHVGTIAVVAGLFRIPIWLERINQTFDEGVFLASNDLVTHGLLPFRDVFSSQGPLFLPLLRASQWASLGDSRGARTLMVVAAVGMSLGFYFIARTFVTPTRAMLLAMLVATSGVGVLAAGPVQSDGLALAFGTAAVALLVNGDQTWRPYASGAALGAALAVKSLHVLPLVVVVAALLWSRRDWRQTAATAATAVGTIVVASLPFGLARVWDQYVLFHLAKDNTVPILDNISEGVRSLFQFDLAILFVIVVLSVMPSAHKTFAQNRRPTPSWLPTLWLVLTVLLLALFTPVGFGFSRALIFVVPPLLLTAAIRSKLRTAVLIVLVGLGVIWQLATVDFVRGLGPSPEGRAIIEKIEELAEDGYIVSDDPGIIWASGRLSHPSTVDPSLARFDTGYLTPHDIELALSEPRTCAYVAISGRFEANSVKPPADYSATDIPGVFIRGKC